LFSDSELNAFLNRMLEAERAGAKALVAFMDDWPRHGEEWSILRKVQADEAHNCAMVGEMLKRSGAAYSHATGEFYDKALAVKAPRERVAFLIKGLE
jgi:nitronate monooxygenase